MRVRITWSLALRLIITVSGVAYLAMFKDWGAILETARTANPLWLLAAWLAYGVTTGLGIVRWHVLLKAFHASMRLARTAQLTLIGLFANNFMPSGMGGDIFKAVLAAREMPHIKPTVIMSIVMERILGFIAMFIVSTTLILSRLGPLTKDEATRYAVILYFVILGLTFIAVALGAWKKTGHFVPMWDRLPASFQTALAEAAEAYRFFLGHKACFWGGLGFSLVAHLSLVLCCYCVACALGLDLDFWDLGAVLPLIFLVMLLLPSIGGLGVRELAFQHFLTYIALTKETSIALSLLFFLVTLSWGLPGGWIYLRFRRPATA